MKKNIFIIISVCTVLISGCSNDKSTVQSPQSISDGENTISYYDKSDTESFLNFRKEVITNEDGLIRSFNINSSYIVTYKGISVGDSISKVEDYYEYEYAMNDKMYSVLFNGSTEVNPTETDKDDSWIWINYTYDNDKITNISIYDVKYGREMR